MPTLIERPSLEENLLLCAELGLDFTELNMNLPEYQLDRLDIYSAKRLFRQYGKYPTIHLEENLNVADFNITVADAYVTTALRTITLAKELDAPIINMHIPAGVYFTLPDRKLYLFEQYTEQYVDRLRQFRDSCDAAIGGSGIFLCVENCGVYHPFQREGIDVLLESPHFALTYDIGHDFCAGNGNEAFIMEREGRLRHMHIHDAAGARHHLALGTGEIDIANKLALARKQECRCVLEIKTSSALRQSVEYLRGALGGGGKE
jgi:sugar phosphate isomerase/epimerase